MAIQKPKFSVIMISYFSNEVDDNAFCVPIGGLRFEGGLVAGDCQRHRHVFDGDDVVPQDGVPLGANTFTLRFRDIE